MRKYLSQAQLNERPLSNSWGLVKPCYTDSLGTPENPEKVYMFTLADSDAWKSPLLWNHVFILDILNLGPILSEFQNLVSPPQNSTL